jgi:hypothetical protein
LLKLGLVSAIVISSLEYQCQFYRGFISIFRQLKKKDKSKFSIANHPELELEEFLLNYYNTPGASFIESLQEELYHNQMEDELRRYQACHQNNQQPQLLSNSPLCFAGVKQYQTAKETLPEKAKAFGINPVVLMTKTPLMEQHTPTVFDATNVYQLRRYGNYQNYTRDNHYLDNTVMADQFIPNLGTPMACLPLMLAGASVAQHHTRRNLQLVVEMGPYFGLSSKCIATGLQQYADGGFEQLIQTSLLRKYAPYPIYLAYDTFEGMDNLKSLEHRSATQWILDTFFSTSTLINDTTTASTPNTNFQFLWERAVWPAYPNSRAIAGRMDGTMLYTAYEQALFASKSSSGQMYTLSLLVIDSAKTAKAWNQQLMAVLGSEGARILQPGTILFLMDFEFVSQQVKQVYGCLRPYLLPVYISWNKEHWAFVVTQEVSLTDQKLCYVSIAKNNDSIARALQRMEAQLEADLLFVSRGLRLGSGDGGNRVGGHNTTRGAARTAATNTTNNNGNDPLKQIRDELKKKMLEKLREKPEHWKMLAKL